MNMNTRSSIARETLFALKSKSFLLALAILLLLCSMSVIVGLQNSQGQRDNIVSLIEQDEAARMYARGNATDFGGAAYNSFYLASNPPSSLAFAAFGQRDISPYTMRVRALALEAQIYESDTINPDLAMVGRFDFAFALAYVVPFFVIFVLYNLVSKESESGRFPLLITSAGRESRIWLPRVLVRTFWLFLAVALPLLFGMLIEGASALIITGALAVVIAQILFWAAASVWLALTTRFTSEVNASVLAGLWLTFALLIPVFGKTVIDSRTEGVEGAQIALLQREVVNGAWDIPKQVTMERFFINHPEWADTAEINVPFHWKWYYAFQQVGDEAAAPLVKEYRELIRERDRLTGLLAYVSPPVAVQRALQSLAQTDVSASMQFEDRIRAFHARIRKAYYPLLFIETAFDYREIQALDIPVFEEIVAEVSR